MGKTYGVCPEQGYIATRDHLKSIRETGRYATTENPEYWLNQISGQRISVEDGESKTDNPIPEWLLYW